MADIKKGLTNLRVEKGGLIVGEGADAVRITVKDGNLELSDATTHVDSMYPNHWPFGGYPNYIPSDEEVSNFDYAYPPDNTPVALLPGAIRAAKRFAAYFASTKATFSADVTDGDVVYLDTDGIWKPALAPLTDAAISTDKKPFYGVAFLARREVVIGPMIKHLKWKFNIGDKLYLSNSEAGKLTTRVTTISFATAVAPDTIYMSMLGADISTSLDELEKVITDRLDSLDVELEALENRVGTLETTVAEHTHAIKEEKARLDAALSAIAQLRAQLNALRQQFEQHISGDGGHIILTDRIDLNDSTKGASAKAAKTLADMIQKFSTVDVMSIDSFITDGTSTDYQVGDDVVLDTNANNLFLVVDGVVQEPYVAYTIPNNKTIRFTQAPERGLRCWGAASMNYSNPDIREALRKALEQLQLKGDKIIALARAWAESDTNPDSDNPNSKSAKKWAEEAAKTVSGAVITVPGTATARPIAKRFGDFVNVKDFGALGDGVSNDTAAINKALSFAAKKKSMLFFPAGVYSAPQALVGFRSIRKIGAGVIKRGDYVYNITPTTLDTNTFYVSPTGSVSNDGLTPDTPITISTAFSSLRYLAGAAESGQWKIKFLPGTYKDNGVRISHLPYFSKPLILEGEREILPISTEAEYSDDFLYYTDNQCTSVPYEYASDTWLAAKRAGLWRQRPTVTWDGTDSTEHYALRMSQPNVIPLTLFMQDITFANWKHSGVERNSGGIAIDCCVTYSLRCRFYNCGVGEWCRSGQSTHKQNVYRDCKSGVCGQYSHSGSVGDTYGGACLFSGCEIGMQVGRASAMHNDGNHYSGCAYSCETAYLSRTAIVGGVYRDWTTACFVQSNNSVVTNPESAKYIGSLHGNTPLALSRFCSNVESGGDGMSPSIVGYAFPYKHTMVHTGTTERTILTAEGYGRLATIPKRSCLVKGTPDSGLIVRIRLWCSLQGSGTAKIELANTDGEDNSFIALDIPTTTVWIEFDLHVSAPEEATGRCVAHCHARILGGSSVAALKNISSSVWYSTMVGETLDANLLRLYVTLSNASDTFTVGGWYTELYRG